MRLSMMGLAAAVALLNAEASEPPGLRSGKVRIPVPPKPKRKRKFKGSKAAKKISRRRK